MGRRVQDPRFRKRPQCGAFNCSALRFRVVHWFFFRLIVFPWLVSYCYAMVIGVAYYRVVLVFCCVYGYIKYYASGGHLHHGHNYVGEGSTFVPHRRGTTLCVGFGVGWVGRLVGTYQFGFIFGVGGNNNNRFRVGVGPQPGPRYV